MRVCASPHPFLFCQCVKLSDYSTSGCRPPHQKIVNKSFLIEYGTVRQAARLSS